MTISIQLIPNRLLATITLAMCLILAPLAFALENGSEPKPLHNMNPSSNIDLLLPLNNFVTSSKTTTSQLMKIRSLISNQLKKSGELPETYLKRVYRVSIVMPPPGGRNMTSLIKVPTSVVLDMITIWSILPIHVRDRIGDVSIWMKSQLHAHATTVKDGIIFATWFKDFNPGVRFTTIVHEIGHIIHINSPDREAEWRSLSGWQAATEYMNSEKARLDGSSSQIEVENILAQRGLVSKYALSKWAEDFAETFASYCLEPIRLQQVSPLKFSFIRDSIFSAASCDLFVKK